MPSSDAADEDIRTMTQRTRPSLVGYVVQIAVGILVPPVAVVGYFAIAVYQLIPLGEPRRHRPSHS